MPGQVASCQQPCSGRSEELRPDRIHSRRQHLIRQTSDPPLQANKQECRSSLTAERQEVHNPSGLDAGYTCCRLNELALVSPERCLHRCQPCSGSLARPLHRPVLIPSGARNARIIPRPATSEAVTSRVQIAIWAPSSKSRIANRRRCPDSPGALFIACSGRLCHACQAGIMPKRRPLVIDKRQACQIHARLDCHDQMFRARARRVRHWLRAFSSRLRRPFQPRRPAKKPAWPPSGVAARDAACFSRGLRVALAPGRDAGTRPPK